MRFAGFAATLGYIILFPAFNLKVWRAHLPSRDILTIVLREFAVGNTISQV